MKSRALEPFGFGSLMPRLIRDILVISRPYDSFILEEDVHFSDRLLDRYIELDLSAPPRFEHVVSGKDALKRLGEKPFDMVLVTSNLSDMGNRKFLARLGKKQPGLPVVMLTHDPAEARTYAQLPRSEGLTQTFLRGDPRLLVAMVKSVEDMQNVDHDVRVGTVRVIIVVEDSPSFYSSFLPSMYLELIQQVQSLLPEGLNERERFYRSNARPKILLARNYEEAKYFFRRFKDCLLGVVCDLSFPRNGEVRQAGRELIRTMRRHLPDLPIVLQSGESDLQRLVDSLGVEFIDKKSPELSSKIRDFMKRNFGFGTFVFRSSDGRALARASTLEEMVEILESVTDDSLRYHASRNHFSNWLMARSEFALAVELKKPQVEDFDDIEELRGYVVRVLRGFLEKRQRGQVAEFSRRTSLLSRDFTRMGTGSMGGKARGIAFLNRLLAGSEIGERYPRLRIIVPRAAVLCTDFFDRFCAQNDLGARAIAARSDEEVVRLFLEQPMEAELSDLLRSIASQVPYPLAVRSSSLHEDSEYHSSAGVYRTFMLPNCSPRIGVRQEQLSRAVRMVFASAFFQNARTFLATNSLRPEQERMAVIIQRLVGRRYGDRFYPDFAGVAQSYNYYPFGSLKAEDGIAAVVLGLGRMVVEGGQALRFSPRHPHVLPQMSSAQEALRSSQRTFFALDLSQPGFLPDLDSEANLRQLDLKTAETDGSLTAIGSTYSPENDVVYDNIFCKGTRLVTFAGVLKHDQFPLTSLLTDLLDIACEESGKQVELEFAANMATADEPAELAVLQLRPMVGLESENPLDIEDAPANSRPLLRGTAMGHGQFSFRDIVYIHPDRMQFARGREVARAIEKLNRTLSRQGRKYILVGQGRWGTSDHWLGIPVNWSQISGSSLIVELVLPESHIEPSQGSHFFHNLTTMRVGFLSIDMARQGHFIDLNWLDSVPCADEKLGVRHLTFESLLEARVDGRSGRGAVFRPA